MFKVKVQGLYVARSPNSSKEKLKKNYEIEGNIPTLVAALSVVKNKLLAPALAKKYPDYVTYLTYNIVQITPLDEQSRAQMAKAEVQFMDRPTLLRYIKDNALPVAAQYYPDLFKLRIAVQYAKDDEAGYLKNFEARKADLELDLAMHQANPELFDTKVEGDFVASISTGAEAPAKQKASSPTVLKKKTTDRLKGLKADQIRAGEMGPMDKVPGATESAEDEGL